MRVETVSVERTGHSLVPLDTLGGLAKASIAAGDKSLDKAEQHYKSPGLYLSEAKERVARTKNLTWPAYLIQHCPIGRRQADYYIDIAEGKVSLAEVRAVKAASSAATYNKYKSAAQSGTSSAKSSENHQQRQCDDKGDDNSESTIAAPAVIEDNILHVIGSMNANARAFGKLLKSSAFDHEAVTRVNTAIDKMIGKWRSIESTLKKQSGPSEYTPTLNPKEQKEFFLFQTKQIISDAEFVGIPDEDVLKAARRVAETWMTFVADLEKRAPAEVIKPAGRKLSTASLKARRKSMADQKTYRDYSKQFGGLPVFVFNRASLRRAEASLKSGVDDFADVKREQEEAQSEYIRAETLRRATLNAPLLAPITPEKEQAYTRLIQTRALYEGACDLSWSDYFQYRIEHSDCSPLSPDDLEYTALWTACALSPGTASTTLH